MLNLEEIRERLRDRRTGEVAMALGLHRNTVTRIRKGRDDNPNYKVVKALSDYLGGDA